MVDYFVGHVPVRGVDHQYLLENVEFVADTDAADCAHVVHVEVQADPEGDLWDVFDFFADIFFAEVDGDEAGEVFEAGFEFLAERSRIELRSGGFDFLFWDVAALDCCVAPAPPVVVLLSSELVEVEKPGCCALGGGDEECPALFVGEGGAEDFESHARVHEGGFVEYNAR